MTAHGSDEQFAKIARHMKVCGVRPIAIDAFKHYYTELIGGGTGLITESEIEPAEGVVDLESIGDHEKVSGYRAAGKAAIGKLVVIKLNGGLGTSMGLDRAKVLLPAREGFSFLDIIVRQITELRRYCGSSVPLVFMNSFRTEEDTFAALARHPEFEDGQGEICCSFLQNKTPKICQKTLLPVRWLKDPALEWCPPGHGDIYTCLTESRLLEDLLSQGYRYAFVSNADNLGATVDEQILGYFAEARLPFMMEVAERTEADKKGGHLAKAKGGGLLLRESAQCPKEEELSFQDTTKYRYFNTNSLWINLTALRDKLEETGGFLKLPLIKNSKTVDPTDSSSPKVFQLETAMGAAISSFSNAEAIKVPRSRFMPVKKTDDLLAIWSDIFILEYSGKVVINPRRTLGTIYIQLDPAYYSTISDFKARFPVGAPSLLECSSLRVQGDVRFGRNVVLKGDVLLKNTEPEQLFIEDGSVITGG